MLKLCHKIIILQPHLLYLVLLALERPSQQFLVVGKAQGKRVRFYLKHCKNAISKRNSLLNALERLFKEPAELQFEDIVGLDLFPNDIKDMLRISANTAASTVSKLSIFPTTASVHSSQLALDIIAATQALFSSIKEPQLLIQTKEASTLNAEKEIEAKRSDFSANCRALCDNLGKILNKLEENINGKLNAEGKFAKSHASMANTGASTVALGTLGTAGVVALICDGFGSLFRELSALSRSSQQECSNPQEKNIYQALSNCTKTFGEKPNSIKSFAALFALEEALLNFKPAADMSKNHSASTPYSSVLIRFLTSGPFLTSLRAANSSAIAFSIFMQALEQNNPSLNTKKSASEASALEPFSEYGANKHSQNLKQLSINFDQIIKQFDALLAEQPIEKGKPEIACLAQSSALVSETVTGATSLMIGLIGSISREISGASDFTRHDQGTKNESKVVLQTHQDNFGRDLDHLMLRVSELKERIDRGKQLGVSAPIALGFLQNTGSGALSLTLQSLMGVGFVLSELRTLCQKPVATSQLAAEERQKAAHYAKLIEDSNQKSANALGTDPASVDLSLQAHLVSVMDKVIFLHHSNFNSLQPNKERKDINWAAKCTLGFTQSNFGFLLGAFGALIYSSLQTGINVEALFHASILSLPDSQRGSEGPDQIKTTKEAQSNFSLMSNLTRLSAEKTEQSTLSQSLLQTTYHLGETLASRTLIIALCQSGAIRKMLIRLTREEAQRIGPMPGFSNTCAASAEIMNILAKNLLDVFDEAANAENRIPGLNQEAAYQLASLSKSSIIGALSSNSLFIVPFLQSSQAIKNAAKNEEKHQHEALSDLSSIDRMISKGSNTLQAFTVHCIEALKELAVHEPDYDFDPIMKSQLTSNKGSASTLIAACCFSLLCEELMELALCRSLTLVDRNKMANVTQQSQEQSQEKSRAASVGVMEDTRGNHQAQKSTNPLPALSLTLANFALSFENLASKLREQSKEENRNLLKPELQLHSSQGALLNSMASMLSHYATALVHLSGTLTRIPLLPILTNGSIDEIRSIIHSSDGQLEFQRIESSAQSAREEQCESTLLTAILTDSLANVQVNLCKLLLNSATIVSEFGLSMAKISEIALSHLHPGQAMRLETQALSQPNGLGKNLSQKLNVSFVSGSIFAATILGESDSASTRIRLHSLQAKVDRNIDLCGMLDDDEEDTTSEENQCLGLRGFYEILIRLIVAEDQRFGTPDEQACKDLRERFHRGGIALSSYHSAHGGLPGLSLGHPYCNPLIGKHNRFVSCNDAYELLSTFIRKAKLSSSLHVRLKQELGDRNQSSKVKDRIEYIEKSIDNATTIEKQRRKLNIFGSRKSLDPGLSETQELAHLNVTNG